MDKRTELEIQRDKYEAVIEERDALISSLRGENEKLKRDLESERGFYREKVSQCDDLKKFIESQRNLMDIVLKNNQTKPPVIRYPVRSLSLPLKGDWEQQRRVL